MIHNVTEGLGIAAPLAEEGEQARIPRLTLVWLDARSRARRRSSARGSAATRAATCSRVVFFAAAAGAALQVVVEVDALRRPPRARAASPPGYAVGGFLAGLAVMYVTGLLAA